MTTIRSRRAMVAIAAWAVASVPATATGAAPAPSASDLTKRTLAAGSRKPDIKTVRLESIVDLDTVPQNWFRPTEPDGWTIRRSPNYTGGGIPPAVKGVYAEFFRVALSGHSCGDYHARGTIDLSQLRANGFRLVEFRYEDVPAPAGYSFDRNGGPNRRPANPAPRDIVELNVSTAILVAAQTLDNRYPHPCWGGIHVRLKVAGPAGVDPLTGQPIRPRRPVN